MSRTEETTLLSIGFGQAWETHQRRSLRFWCLGIAANMTLMIAATLAWASVVTRELPVITLAPSDTGVCAQWRPMPTEEWSDIQVRAWITTLAKAAMVQDSRLVQDNLQAVTSMLSPALRAEFRQTDAMRTRFADMQRLNIQGALRASEFTINCGDNPRFHKDTAPWLCIAYGGIAYRPAIGPMPDNALPVTSYFFVELAIQPGEVTLSNPLGLEAVQFVPREAETQADLERMVAEERL